MGGGRNKEVPRIHWMSYHGMAIWCEDPYCFSWGEGHAFPTLRKGVTADLFLIGRPYPKAEKKIQKGREQMQGSNLGRTSLGGCGFLLVDPYPAQRTQTSVSIAALHPASRWRATYWMWVLPCISRLPCKLYASIVSCRVQSEHK